MAKRVAYLGPEGTFGWRVATRDNHGATFIPYRSHAQVMEAVKEGEAEIGYVARENSLGGMVVDTVEPLLRNRVGTETRLEGGKLSISQGDLMLYGETVLPIEQCLYGREDQDAQRVYSHPQALAQCEAFLKCRFPGAELVHVNSTVGGVEKLYDDWAAVAIAPPWAEKFYPDISILERRVQDARINHTRFLVVAKDDRPSTGRDKTSLWFTVPEDEKAGTFDNVSQVLALAKINKTAIESRPLKTTLGKYVFLVDIDGHRRDRVVELALELIVRAGHTTTLTVLGSYPRWNGTL